MSFVALTGRMPSVTVGDFDVNTLSVHLVQREIGDLRTVDENQIWKLRAYSLEIVPRVSHPETRPVFCSADLNEANCCCNKIVLLALVKARVAVLQL